MSLTGLVFALCFFAGLGMAFARHPIYGLYTYVAVFYLHPPSRWWGAQLPDLRWALLAAVVTLIATMRLPPDKSGKAPWYTTTPAKILIIFTIWVWIQNLWALAPTDHRDLTVLYTKYLLLFYLIYRLIETPEQMRDLLLVNLAGCGYLGYLAFIHPVSGRLEGVGGPGIDEANALAMQLGTGVVIAAMFVLVERKWRMWFCLAVLPFLLNAIVLAGSRGAFLAIITSGVVLWFLKPRSHRALFYAFAVLGVVLLGMLAQQTFWSRMGTMKAGVDNTQQMDNSAESRFHIIAAQWEMAKDHPMGTGHRGTAVLSPDYLDEKYMSRTKRAGEVAQRSSHNTFMSALVEQGVLGGILFASLWIWWIGAVFKLRARAARMTSELAAMGAGIAAALCVLLIAGLFVDYLKAEIQIWLLILMTCVLHFSAPQNVAAKENVAQARRARRRAGGAISTPSTRLNRS
jgi:O-antigen ligase